MLTKNLSKSDYYKSRNIAIPKPLHKLAQQPQVRSHLIQPIPSLAIQIKRHLQTKKSKENLQLQHLGYEPTLHDLQVRLQDLNRLLANREDEITGMKNEKEKDERRITFLDKEVFDLRAQLQKVEYEYKTTIQFLKVENQTQKNEYLQKISSLEDQLKKAKQDYDSLLKDTKQSYDVRMKSISGTKEALKFASQELMNGLKKDIEYHISQNKRLKNELIMSEREVMYKLKDYEEQNFMLKEKLDHQELQFSLTVMKTNTEVELRNTRIAELNDQIEEMHKSFEAERQKLDYEKQYIERAKVQKQAQLRQNIQKLIFEKQSFEKDFHRLINQLDEIKDLNFQLQKRVSETSTKLSFLEFQKEQRQMKFKQKIEQIKDSQKTQFQNEIQSLKKSYQQKITLVEKDLDEKENEVFYLKDKILKLNLQIQEKSSLIKALEEKEKTSIVQLEKFNEMNQQLNRDMKMTKKQIEILKMKHENEKQGLLNKIQEQKSSELLEAIKESKQTITVLRQQTIQIKTEYENKLKFINEQTQNKQKLISKFIEENNLLKREREFIQSKYDSLNSLYEEDQAQHKDFTSELQKIIDEQVDSLKRNTQNIEQLKIQYNILKHQLVEKEIQIDKMEKDLRQVRIQSDQIKLQSIRKCSDLEQKMQSTLNELQRQKNSLLLNLKKTGNQVTNLTAKLQHTQLTIENLQSQKQLYLSQNKRLKESYAQREQNANNLLNELNLERKEMAEKISQDYKQKIVKLQQRNESLIYQISQLKQAVFKSTQTAFNNQALVKDYQTALKEKISELTDYKQMAQNEKAQIQKLEDIVSRLTKIKLDVQNEKTKLQSQIQMLTKQMAEFEENVSDMKKSNLYENGFMNQLRSRLNRLLVTNEEQKMEIQFQLKQKQNLKTQLKETKRQLETKKEQFEKLEEIVRKNKEIWENQINQDNRACIRFEKKNKELIEKLALIEQKIASKEEEHLKQLRKVHSEKENLIQKLQQKQKKYKIMQEEHNTMKQKAQEIIKQLPHLQKIIEQKDKQITYLRFQMKKFETNKNSELVQVHQRCKQIQQGLKIMSQKYQAEVQKVKQIQKTYSLQIIKLKEDCVNQDEQIEILRKKIRQLEQNKEEIRVQIGKEFDEALLNYKIQRQSFINKLNADHELNIQLLKNQIKELNEQRQKSKKEYYSLKMKYDAEIAKKDEEYVLLQKQLKKYTRMSQFLFEYKSRWDRISGQFKENDHFDPTIAQQVQNSFSKSCHNSIIIDEPLLSKIERDKLILGKNVFSDTPQTAFKDETEKKEKKYRYEDLQTVERAQRMSQKQQKLEQSQEKMEQKFEKEE